MIVHVVMMKMADDAPDDAAQTVHDRLMALPETITEIKHYEVGLNILESERNYDLVLISKFESMDALEAYRIHPDHQNVLTYIRSVTSSTLAVDYEMV